MALNTNDLTANANHLTNNNGATEVTTNLPFLQSTAAADFELSSSQYLSITDAAQNGALDITGDISIEAWVKLEQLPSTAGSNFGIVTKYNATGDQRSYEVFIGNADDKLYMDWSEDGTGAAGAFSRWSMDTAFGAGDVGVWRHIAITVDVSADTAVFYKDTSVIAGTQALSGATTGIFNSTADFIIGGRFNDTTPVLLWDGQLDDVRVWSDIRTAQEIADNYNIELAGNEANLAFYLPFEATLGTTTSTSTSSSTTTTSTSTTTTTSTSSSTSTTTTSTSTTTTSTSTTTTSTSTTTTTSTSTSTTTTSTSTTMPLHILFQVEHIGFPLPLEVELLK